MEANGDPDDPSQGAGTHPQKDSEKNQRLEISAGGGLLDWIQNQNIKSPEKTSSFIKAINSPLGIAMASGLGIWLITFSIQNRHADKESQKEFQQKVFDKKIELASRFADVSTRFMQNSFSMRKREVWIAQLQQFPLAQRLELTYPDGRKYPELRDFYEKEKTDFNKIEHPLTILSQLQGYFTDSISLGYMSGIREDLKVYLQLTDQDSLNFISDRIDVNCVHFVDHMNRTTNKGLSK